MIQWRNHEVEDVEVGLLLSALKERYGYDFTDYARASLKRRLRQLQTYFDVHCLSELIPILLYDERVAQTVVNNISVLVSDFFRDPPVWKFVREEILPRLDSFPQINIWQAGCGRGQETYTLMILLQEAGLLKKTRLVATDINLGAMEDARLGRWPARDFAQWSEAYAISGGREELGRYFTFDGTDVVIHDDLRQHVEFNSHNLVIDEGFMETQLVVCRNVLIYFNCKLQEKVLGLFSRSLQRGGYLLLGKSESMMDATASTANFQQVSSEYSVYRKVRGA